jgi:hypothetical protein
MSLCSNSRPQVGSKSCGCTKGAALACCSRPTALKGPASDNCLTSSLAFRALRFSTRNRKYSNRPMYNAPDSVLTMPSPREESYLSPSSARAGGTGRALANSSNSHSSRDHQDTLLLLSMLHCRDASVVRLMLPCGCCRWPGVGAAAAVTVGQQHLLCHVEHGTWRIVGRTF